MQLQFQFFRIIELCSYQRYAGFAGDNAPCAVFLGLQAHDARHQDRYGTEGQLVRLQKTVESPQLQSIQVVDFSFAAQRQSLMVQTLCQTMVIPQLLTRWSTSLLCRSREFHMCRRGEACRAPTVALVVVFVGAAHHRVDELMG